MVRHHCARPDVKARRSAAQLEAQNRDGAKEKQRAKALEVQNRPEVRAKNSEAQKAAWARRKAAAAEHALD